MPEESIAAYISNIITFTIFIAVIIFAFVMLFLLSRILIYRTGRKYYIKPKKEIFPGRSSYLLNYKKDPCQLKNIFILSTIFTFTIFFIFLILVVMNYIRQFEPGLNLFLIIGMVIYLILMIIYLVRSKIIS